MSKRVEQMKILAVHIADIIVAAVVIISVYTDIKERKILNAVVLPAALAGLAVNSVFSGMDGFIFSLKGLGAGIGLLFIPFVLGGFGAGDVKLMGAIGALKGALFAFKAFLATGIAGGILAILLLVKQGRLLATLKRIWLSFFLGSVFKVNTLKSLDKAEFHESLPYGLAIGIGTLLAYLVG